MKLTVPQAILSLLAASLLPTLPAQEPAVPRAKPVEDVPKANPVAEDPPPAPQPSPAEAIRQPAEPTAPKQEKAGSSAEEDLFNYAYMLYKRESNELGIEQFTKYLAAYAKGKHVDASLTLRGECFLRLHRVDEAVASYLEVTKRFKSGQFLAYAASRLGTLKFNDEKPMEAAPYFDIAAANASKADDRVQYRYYQGLALKRGGKEKEAAAAFEAVVKLTGSSGSRSFQEKALLELANYELAHEKKTSAFNRFEKLSKEGSSAVVKAEASVSAGMILQDAGKHKEALSYFDVVTKAGGEGTWVALAKQGQIRTAYATENWKKVVDAWGNLDIKAIKLESRPALIVMVANAHRFLEQFARAIDLYGMVEQFFPESGEVSQSAYYKLVCLYKLKDPRTDAAAEAFIERAKQKDPQSEYLDMARMMRAEDAFAKKNWELAVKSYGGIRLEKIPEDLRSSMLYRKGWAEAQQGNHSAAIESLNLFMAQSPKDPLLPQAMVRKAQSYLEIKDITNAIKEFDSVITLFPKAREAEEAYRLGGLLRGQDKNYEGMIQHLTAMLEKYPESKYKGECKFWIGTGLFGLKKWKECIGPLHEAQTLYPENFEDASIKIIVAYNYLEDVDGLAQEVDAYVKTNPKAPINGRILEYLGSRRYSEKNPQQAARYFGLAVTSVQVGELRPNTWFQLSDARLQIGDHAGVLLSVDKLLGLATELPANTKAKAYYFRGKANLALKKLDDARKDADAGLKLHTQDVNESRLYYLRGEIEEARGNDEEAASNYVLTTQLVLNDEIAVEAYRRLLQIFRKKGQPDKEAQFLKSFRSSFPKESAAFEKDFPAITAQPQ